MTAWLFRLGLGVVLALSALSLWTLHDTQQPAAPAPAPDPEPVLWVRDEHGMWHCEPWSTLPLDQILSRCDVTDLPPEAFTEPIPEGIPVG